jgi:hypothetical protein
MPEYSKYKDESKMDFMKRMAMKGSKMGKSTRKAGKMLGRAAGRYLKKNNGKRRY